MDAKPEASADPSEVLTKALVRAADRLGLSQKALAKATGVSEATVSRWRHGNLFLDPGSKEGEIGLLLLRAYRSLDTLLGGNEQQVRDWMRADNLHLGGAPSERLQSIEGLVHVVDYLDAMRGKL